MDSMIRDFALQILRRLQKRSPKGLKTMTINGAEEDENMEDGQLPSEELIQTPYLSEEIELPAEKSLVLQHVELLFALSVKIPEFLDEYVPPPPSCGIPEHQFIFQNIFGLRSNGLFRPRSSPRFDHRPRQISRVEQRQIADPHADLPPRL